MLEDDIRKSLIDAGIGRVYHEMRLPELDDVGKGLVQFLKVHGDNLKKGHSFCFHGNGIEREIKVLAKTLHMNRLGTRIVSTRQLSQIIQRGGERMEEVVDAPVLFVMPFLSDSEPPSERWKMADVEDFLRNRIENLHTVILLNTLDGVTKSDTRWWGTDFLAFVEQTCTMVLKSDLTDMAAEYEK